MSDASIAGVILDVGGTLWPDNWHNSEADVAERDTRIAAALGISDTHATEVGRALEAAAATREATQLQQDNVTSIRSAAAELGLQLSDAEILGVRRAMCIPASGRIHLFPNARELLATIKALGLDCVLLSNATWRDAEAYGRDLDELGVSRFVDAVVTSLDAGWRKPHPRTYERALAAIGCVAADCVMIGNSEENDILPALALGMRAIRVAIEEPRPDRSAAHAITGSLHEAADVVRSWIWADAAV
jgi:putative hydrolase of the HAD superfamily